MENKKASDRDILIKMKSVRQIEWQSVKAELINRYVRDITNHIRMRKIRIIFNCK